MDCPIDELEGVVRCLTESKHTYQVFETIDRYFTEDIAIFYPVFNQLYTRNGRENLKAAYQWRRTFTYDDKVIFNAVMLNDDQTEATLDIIQILRFRLLPIRAFDARLNYIVRVSMRKCHDGKYRVYRQQDNFPTDLTMSGLPLPRFVRALNDLSKALGWLVLIFVGHIMIALGLF